MISVNLETRPDFFLARCGGYLAAHPAEHSLILSMCQLAEKKRLHGKDANVHLITFANDDGLVLAAAQMPNANLVLSRATSTDMQEMVDILVRQKTKFPGVIGPSDVAGSFANAWCAASGQKQVEFMDQIIYALTKVVPPQGAEGMMRLARADEEKIIASWMQDFTRQTLPKSEYSSEEAILRRAHEVITESRAFVWELKGEPVCLATVGGTKDAPRIGTVYTPEQFRGNGYASALVADLSEKKIKDGAKLCCLYADARNPVSNSIYRKIGYEFVGRSSHYVLD
jgi:predicted GNAT family acetyltransferase